MTETLQKQVASLLGLCLRSGQLVLGQESCVQLIRSGQGGVAFMDANASDNTKKRLQNACAYYQVPLYEFGSGVIAHAIGKGGCLTVAVHSGGFSEKMVRLLVNEPRNVKQQDDTILEVQ